jgi:hypothetical protein
MIIAAQVSACPVPTSRAATATKHGARDIGVGVSPDTQALASGSWSSAGGAAGFNAYSRRVIPAGSLSVVSGLVPDPGAVAGDGLACAVGVKRAQCCAVSSCEAFVVDEVAEDVPLGDEGEWVVALAVGCGGELGAEPVDHCDRVSLLVDA